MANKLLVTNLSEPLDGAKAAKIDINCGQGHLTIDKLTGGGRVLASGTLEYFEKQGAPRESVDASLGQVTLSLKAGEGSTRQSWLRLPWAACGGAYEWQVHLNPAVPSDLTAHSDGGNVKLDLAEMPITHLAVDTGGGNMEVVLPEDAVDLSVSARTGGGNITVKVGDGIAGSNTVEAQSGAGNVVVSVPAGLAARIQATSGLGKVIVDPRFVRQDKSTYQSTDYETAANKIDLALKSGAGNVVVNSR